MQEARARASWAARLAKRARQLEERHFWLSVWRPKVFVFLIIVCTSAAIETRRLLAFTARS